MRSNSGKDEGRNNMRDPTVRDRTEQRTQAITTARTFACQGAGRPSRRPQGLAAMR